MELGDPLIGGITLQMALIILGFLTFLGVIIWAMKIPKLKGLGMGMTLLPLALVFILIVSMAATSATIVVPGDQQPLTSDVLSVAATYGNYSQSSHTITVVLSVNTTDHTANGTANQLYLNYTVQRTDAGQSTDVKTLTMSYSPSTLVDPVTGLSYSSAEPNTDGRPQVNWTLGGTTIATASRTLSAQMGMTPFQTVWIGLNVEWNGAAVSTSNVAINDVVSLGSVNIGGEIYQIQGLIAHVWFNGGGA